MNPTNSTQIDPNFLPIGPTWSGMTPTVFVRNIGTQVRQNLQSSTVFSTHCRTVEDKKFQCCDTGKSFSEALIPASTNPQYDKRLFMELQTMKTTRAEHGQYILHL